MSARTGPIQKKLMQWIREGGRTYIACGKVPPPHIGLIGQSWEEVEASLNRLQARGLIVSDKPGFYSLPKP